MPVPLVLLPGMNCSPRLWDGVVQDLEADRPDPVAGAAGGRPRGRPTDPRRAGRVAARPPAPAVRDRRAEPRCDRRDGGPPAGARAGGRPLPRRDERATSHRGPTRGVVGAARLAGGRSLVHGTSRRSCSRSSSGPTRRRTWPPGPWRWPTPSTGRLCGPSSSSSRPASTNDRGSPEQPFPAPSSRRRRTASARSNGIARSTNSSEDRSFSSSRALPTWWRCRTRTRWPRPLRRGYSGWTADRSAARATRAVCRGGGSQVGEHAHEHLRNVVDDEPPARREDPSGVVRAAGELGAP